MMDRGMRIGLIACTLTVVVLWTCVFAVGVPGVPMALGMTALLLIVAAGVAGGVFWHRRARARALEQAMRLHGDAHASQLQSGHRPEVETLRRDFEGAVQGLRASKLGARGRDALYGLPWYVVIGPPGAGKSTALQNSGLEFPSIPGANQPHRGFAGTRHCDWWLSNQAVLLDTAGRWSLSEDQEEWDAFVDLLKEHRSKQPLNGIMVAISVAELMDEGTRATAARRVRERVEEIMSRLGFVLPVYVLFTKTDLIAGFAETFSGLDADARGQIFGFTADPVGGTSYDELFAERFDELVRAVQGMVPSRLAAEPRAERRELILEFPVQLMAHREAARGFLSELFRENAFQHVPLFRGAYFTSGTQVGRPVDQLLAKMGSAFQGERTVAVPSPQMQSRSYFLQDVFKSVVFQDTQMAMPNRERRERGRWRVLGASLGLSLVSFLLLCTVVFGGCGNLALLHRAQHLASGQSAEGAEGRRLPELRAVVEALRQHGKEGPPVHLALGLYQGREIYPAIRDGYLTRIRAQWLDNVLTRTERELSQLDPMAEPDGRIPGEGLGRFHRAYRQLKAYLLLTVDTKPSARGGSADAGRTAPWSASHAERHARRKFLNAWLARHLQSGESSVSDKEAELFVALLDELTPEERRRVLPSRTREVVRSARAALTGCAYEELALAQLVEQFSGHTLHGAALGLERGVFQAKGEVQVRGAFTRTAWNRGVRDMLHSGEGMFEPESWVLAERDRNPDAPQSVHLDAAREAYFRAYVSEWRGFLDQVSGVAPTNRAESLRLLQRWTGGDPTPLEALLERVDHHATLELPEVPERSILASVGGLMTGENGAPAPEGDAASSDDSVPDRSARVLGAFLPEDPWRAPTARPPATDPRYVRAKLRGFLRFSGGDEGGAASPRGTRPLQVTLEQLRFVRDRFQTFLEDESTGNDLLGALQEARTQVRGLVETQDVGWRPNFDALISPILDGAAESSVMALGSQVGRQWCADVWGPFRGNLHDAYPFSSRGADASLEEFHAFFGPETGTLWQFQQGLLGGMVRSGSHGFEFVERVGSDTDKVLSAGLPAYLDRAARVTEAFYPAGEHEAAGSPQFPFEVRILPAPGIAVTEFSIDGKRVRHVNGPERWTRVAWPREESEVRGAMIAVQAQGGVRETLREQGVWGLFRLLELAEVHREPNRVFRVRWQLSRPGLFVEVLIRPERTRSPLSQGRVGRRSGSRSLLQFLRRVRQLPEGISNDQNGCGG